LAVVASALWFDYFNENVFWAFFKKHFFVSLITATGICFMVGAAFIVSSEKTKNDLSGGWAFTRYKKAAAFLRDNTENGDVIVHGDWDDMPPLFYWNDANRYIIGLDPTFFYRADPGRYARYVAFTLGESTDPVRVMDELNSRFVFTDREHRALTAMLGKSGRFVRIYLDSEAEIYQLK
jgi:hypothetical protein